MVVVAGSINLDLVADVARLPRPGETLPGHAFRSTPGGKGANQALAARRAGADVALYGATGDDAFATAALALLRRDGVDLSGVRVVDAPTGVAMIHVAADGENAITVVPGANALVTADFVPSIDPAGTLVMQLEIPIVTVTALARAARARRTRVVLNAAPAMPLPAELTGAIDVLVVNEQEAAMVANELGLSAAPADFARGWAARFGSATVVTLGAQGLVAATRGGVVALRAPSVDVVDTVGAGDALVGALAAALDRGAALLRALREGVAAGSLACSRRGAQDAMPTRAEIAARADTI
jgi:ribokinase